MTLTPYVTITPKTPVKSAEWNAIQTERRQALQNHDHSGTGDNAKPVGTSGIEDGAISTTKLLNGTVSGAKLAPNAVQGTHLVDNSLTNEKIVSLEATKLTGQLTTEQFVDGAVTGTKILEGTIEAANITNSAISNNKITSLDAGKLTGTITMDNSNIVNLTSPLQLGNAPDNAPAGTLRWNGTNFEAKVGGLDTDWVVFPGGKVKQIVFIVNSVYIVTEHGDLWVAGKNDYGQLGVGDTIDLITWRKVTDSADSSKPSGVNSLVANGYSAYALTKTGDLWVVGYNGYGQLGVADTTNQSTWAKVTDSADSNKPSAIISVVFSKIGNTFVSAYALTEGGDLWVAGFNGYGQFGLNHTTNQKNWVKTTDSTDSSKPSGIKSVVAHAYSAYLLTTAGDLWVAGYNTYGQLGVGDKIHRNTWEKVTDSTDSSKPGAIVSLFTSHLNSYTSVYILSEGGDLWVAGYNADGQLGVGDTDSRDTWSKVTNSADSSKLSGVNSLVTGDYSIYALTEGGDLWVTGKNTVGQLGVGDVIDRNTWEKVTNSTDISKPSGVNSLVTGGYSIYALTEGGDLWVTGDNTVGQLGVGDTDSRDTWSKVTNSADSSKLSGVNSLVANGSAYALTETGDLWVTGYNAYGQLGVGDIANQTTWEKVTNSADNNKPNAIVSLVTSSYSTSVSAYALTETGDLWVVGANANGELGLAGTANQRSWVNLTGNTNKPIGIAGLVSPFDYHAGLDSGSSYVWTQAGELWVAGKNNLGQLGVGDTENRAAWEKVTDSANSSRPSAITSVVTSHLSESAYALTETGDLWVTGYNAYGQLGLGITDDQNSWIKVTDSADNNKPSAITNLFTNNLSAYALTQGGDLWVVGSNGQGQLGLGVDDTANRATWEKVTDSADNSKPSAITNVVMASTSTYILTEGGDLWVAGKNTDGQLGVGDTANQTIWEKVTDSANSNKPSGISRVVGNKLSAYAITEGGDLWVAGNNANGQFGISSTIQQTAWRKVTDNASSSRPPSAVVSVVTSPHSSSYYSTYAITQGGELWVTGANTVGELGVGNTNQQEVWQKVTDSTDSSKPSGIKSVVTNGYSAYALTESGALWVVGHNYYGQLGLGNTDNKTTWIKVTDSLDNAKPSGIKNVVTRGYSVYALTEGGDLWVAGKNTDGQLGVGNTDNQNTWIKVTDNADNSKPSGVIHVVTYSASAYVLTEAGELWVTGKNGFGELGEGIEGPMSSWKQLGTPFLDLKK